MKGYSLKAENIALTSILIVGIFLLTFDLGGRSLWWDEIINILIDRESLGSILASLQGRAGVYHDLGHPPFPHLLMHHWLKEAAGNLIARLPAASFALLSVPLLYRVGKELADERLGLLGAYLLAISPFYILYARMARYYSLATALALLSCLIYIRLLKEGTGPLWIAHTLISSLLIYTNYLLASILVCQSLFLLLFWRRYKRTLGKWFLAQIAVMLSYLVWLPTLTCQASRVSEFQVADLAFSPLGYLLKVGMPFLSYSAGETLFPWEPVAVAGYIAFGLLALTGALFLKGKGTPGRAVPPLAFVLTFFLLPLFTTILVVSVLTPTIPFAGIANRTIFALPFFLLLVAGGILRLPKRSLQIGALALITLIHGFGLRNYFTGQHFHNPIYAVSIEEAVQYVISQSREGDMILSTDDTGFAYYYERTGHGIPYHNLLGENPLDYAEGAGRVWLVLFGRDRTRTLVPTEEFTRELKARGYTLALSRGYVEQDETYRWVKERLLKRPAYTYKLEVELYVSSQS